MTSRTGAVSQRMKRARLEAGLQQHELAVARDEIIEDLTVRVARLEPIADQDAEVARERRLGSSIDSFWQTMQRSST